MGGVFFMKVKAVLKSLLFAYGITGVFLLLLAFLLFKFDIGEGPVTAGIIAVYVLSCLLGGFMAGRMVRKDKYLWGILVGLFYFLLLAAASFGVQGKWDMTVQHAVTTFFMCLGGGALGGMLS
jgi:putative membrane protein (TIGR04086 family)